MGGWGGGGHTLVPIAALSGTRRCADALCGGRFERSVGTGDVRVSLLQWPSLISIDCNFAHSPDDKSCPIKTHRKIS